MSAPPEAQRVILDPTGEQAVVPRERVPRPTPIGGMTIGRLATSQAGGDTFLGGVDFDDRLMQFVLCTFADYHDVDLSYDRRAVPRVRESSALATIRLSTVDTTVLDYP